MFESTPKTSTKSMAAISNRQPAVDIEYDSPRGRIRKHFTNPYKAKRFYADKLKAGRNPKVCKPLNVPAVDPNLSISTEKTIMAKTTSKKTATKTARPSKVVGKKKKVTETTKPDGLTKRETAVLTALSKAPNGLNRAQLKEKTGISGGLSAILGASTKEGLGAGGATSLEGKGLVKSQKFEDNRSITYTITAAGRKALGKES